MLYAVATSLSIAFSLSAPPASGCVAGVRSAVHSVSMGAAVQEDAKKAWLEQLDAVRAVGPAKLFGGDAVGTIVPTAAAAEASIEAAEEAAKQAWLAKLDAPTWGKAAAAVSKMAAEEAAKQAWLASLDTPTWGGIAAAVSEVAATVQATPSDDAAEEAAKQAWLAKLDAPTWGKAAAALVDAAGAANVAADEAKRAWLAKLEKVQADGPVKTFGGASMAAIVSELREDADKGVEESRALANDALAAEEAAKKAWLASLDVPTWGAVAKAVTAIAEEVAAQPAMTAEDIAKREWLAKVEAARA